MTNGVNAAVMCTRGSRRCSHPPVLLERLVGSVTCNAFSERHGA